MDSPPSAGASPGSGKGDGAEHVDLEAIIADFLSGGRPSLELPRSLTAQQRKEAKRLADQHAQLKCESYGFGEERRLHIFNTNVKEESSSPAVRVKNTFIDDFTDGNSGGEQSVFRSVPPSFPENLLERTLQRYQNQQAANSLASMAESPGPTGTEHSPSSSVTPSAGPAELPPLPDGFEIRNTFIHIESVPVMERVVQSMPAGMFQQCLAEELAQQKAAAVAAEGASTVTGAPQYAPTGNPTAPPMPASVAVPGPIPTTPPPSEPAPGEGALLTPGTEVVIQGLVKLPDFNGLKGVVQSLDEATGRYDVLLTSAAGKCGWRWVKVKGENCRPCLPPPPRNAPTLSMEVLNEGDEGEAPPGEAGDGPIPATPMWEEDLAHGQKASPLKLNGLV